GPNSIERLNERRDVAAVMSVDRPDAAVAIDVVAGEENVAETKAELTVRVSRREPNFELQSAHLNLVPVFQFAIDLDRRHRHIDFLGLDLGEGPQLVSHFQR